MKPDMITPAAVQRSLNAIRYGKPMDSDSLLDLDFVRLHLREEGIVSSHESAAWALGVLLATLVDEALGVARAPDVAHSPRSGSVSERARELDQARGRVNESRSGSTPAAERAALRADFSANFPERELWSLLHHRYFSLGQLQMKELVSILDLPRRTLGRRLTAAHVRLAEELRAREHSATTALAKFPGASPHERIVVRTPLARSETTLGETALPRQEQPTPGAAVGTQTLPEDPSAAPSDRLHASHPEANAKARDVGLIEAELLSAIRSDDRTISLEPGELERILLRPVADVEAYLLSRIATWRRPGYRLDSHFVDLTMLVDQGSETEGERWQPDARRFEHLAEVMDVNTAEAFVVLGPPGSGKSTLLRRIELDLAAEALRDAAAPLPFFVSLNSYRAVSPSTVSAPGDPLSAALESPARAGRSWKEPFQPNDDPPPEPLEWLERQWAQRYPELPPLAVVWSSRPIVLLLDGLNEMPHADVADYRLRIRAWKVMIREVLANRRASRAVFTCRSLDYGAPLSSPAHPVPQVRIEPLDDDKIQLFLKRHAVGRAEEIWGTVASTPQLDFLRIPFLLKLLVEQSQRGKPLSLDRAALFTGFVRRTLQREIERDNPIFLPGSLLDERDYRRSMSSRSWPTPATLPERGALFTSLSLLANSMQVRKMRGDASLVHISYDEAAEIVGPELIDDVLRAGAALTLIHESWDRDEIMFFHQLMQEYFAARYVAAHPGEGPEFARVEVMAERISPSVEDVLAELAPSDSLPPLPTSGWEETLLMSTSVSEAPDVLIRDLMLTNLPLAGRCAAQSDVRERLDGSLVESLRESLVQASRDPRVDLRARIASGLALGELGDPRFVVGCGPSGDEFLTPPLIDIAGGRYSIGDDEAPGKGGDFGAPRHDVKLAAFRIGRFDVTNAEWSRFMNAGGYEDERWWEGRDAEAWRRGETSADALREFYYYWCERLQADLTLFDNYLETGVMIKKSYDEWHEMVALDGKDLKAYIEIKAPSGRIVRPLGWADSKYTHPAQPVTGICWFEARAYCRWLSEQTGVTFRLPTEVEWEAAAGGKNGRRYPYGDEFIVHAGNTPALHYRRPLPIGVLPEGDTPEGIADLCGGVQNLTSTNWGEDADSDGPPYPYTPDDGREDQTAPPKVYRILRSGSFWTPRGHSRSAARVVRGRIDCQYRAVGLRLVISDMGQDRLSG